MSLNKKLTAKEIVRNSGICPDPHYFSGRGATLSDLNPEQLEKTYYLIQKNHGKKAAKNFVQMVEEMQVLSATDFLVTLYALESNKWKYENEKVKSDLTEGILVRKDVDGRYDLIHGMISMDSALHRRGRDDTEMIRGPFLSRHGKNTKNDSRGIPIYGFF